MDIETWKRLDEFLLYAWKHPAGHSLRPAVVCVDTGYATDVAYAYVQRCQPRRVLAVKGSKGGYGEPLIERPRKSGVDRVALWMVGTVTAKELVYARLQIAEDGPGRCHFPRNPRRGYDQAYFRGITAEKAVWKMEAGRKVLKFIPGEYKRNEPLDIRCYILGGLDVLRPNYGAISKRLAQNNNDDDTQEHTSGGDRTMEGGVGASGAGSSAATVATLDAETGKIVPAVAPEAVAEPNDVASLPAQVAPEQKPRPAPNITLPHKFRRPRTPGRGGFVQAWRQ